MEKPTVMICGYCQKQFPAVDAQVFAHKDEINFSHGLCGRHSLEMFKQLPSATPEKVAAKIAQLEANKAKLVPDLAERTDLQTMYAQGVFTEEQLLKRFTERLQKLANILKD